MSKIQAFLDEYATICNKHGIYRLSGSFWYFNKEKEQISFGVSDDNLDTVWLEIKNVSDN